MELGIEEIREFLNDKIQDLDPEDDAEAINSYQLAQEHLDYGYRAEHFNQSTYGESGGEDY